MEKVLDDIQKAGFTKIMFWVFEKNVRARKFYEKYGFVANGKKQETFGAIEIMYEKEWNRMIDQKLYNPYKVGGNTFETVHAAQKKFNESEYWKDRTAFEELKKCFKEAPDDMVLTPPVYFDHGNRISFGKHFYANTGLTILG